jgi:hypothetical protein
MRRHPISTAITLATLLSINACKERPTDLASIAPDKEFTPSGETAQDVAAIPESGICSLENVLVSADGSSSPGDVPNSWTVGRGELFRLYGFAINKQKESVPGKLTLLLVGPKVYKRDAATGSPRPDVARVYNLPVFAKAGYECEVGFDAVVPGQYEVFGLHADGDRQLVCRTFQTITVR